MRSKRFAMNSLLTPNYLSMKNIVKIILIVLAVAGIGTAVFLFFNNVDEGKEEVIATSSFEKTIQSRVANEITDKSYNEASNGYDAIIGAIQTEASITLGDGTPNLKPEERLKCEKMAFYAYAPIFTTYAIGYFSRQAWNENEMATLRSRSNALLAQNIAEPGTDVAVNLKKVIETIGNYYAAKSVIASAKSCTTANAVESIKTKAASYKTGLLVNNTTIMSGLNNAYSDAKASYGRYVSSQALRIASGYRGYGSYPNWYNNYEHAHSLIKEYTSKYGNEQLFTEAKWNLDNADSKAMDYYSD